MSENVRGHVNLKLSLQMHTFFGFYCLFCPISILLHTLNSICILYYSQLKMTEELSQRVF